MPRERRNPKSPTRPPPRPTKKGKDRSQEDNVWKEALDDLLEQFMALLFENYHKLIDWTRGYESLDKEMIEISEEGGFSKQAADKLYRVFLKTGEEQLVLLHVEIQGYADEKFAERVWNYKNLIQRKYRQQVLSFAVLTDLEEDFRPREYRWEFEEHLELYRFPSVKILDYWQKWEELEGEKNPFAVVVMAHLKAQRLRDRPIDLKEARLELLKLLFKGGYEREFMIRLIQFMEGLVRLPPVEEAEYQAEAQKLAEEDVKMALVSVFERIAKQEGLREGEQKGLREGEQKGLRKGEQKGLRKGKQEGLREGEQKGMLVMTTNLLEQRFGPLEPELSQPLETLTTDQLQALSKRLLSLSSKDDLKTWLEQS